MKEFIDSADDVSQIELDSVESNDDIEDLKMINTDALERKKAIIQIVADYHKTI